MGVRFKMILYISTISQHHYFQGPIFLQRNDTAHTRISYL